MVSAGWTDQGMQTKQVRTGNQNSGSACQDSATISTKQAIILSPATIQAGSEKKAGRFVLIALGKSYEGHSSQRRLYHLEGREGEFHLDVFFTRYHSRRKHSKALPSDHFAMNEQAGG